MSRENIKQERVLEIVVTHLRETLGLSESRCYETVRPDQLPKVPSGSDYVLTVSMGDGSFEIPEQFAGQCCEEIDVVVMAFTRVNLDPSNPDTALLHDSARGLLKLKQVILRTLVGQDLGTSLGSGFLRDLIYAKRSIAPDVLEAKTGTVGGVGIVFGLKHDWDLSDS